MNYSLRPLAILAVLSLCLSAAAPAARADDDDIQQKLERLEKIVYGETPADREKNAEFYEPLQISKYDLHDSKSRAHTIAARHKLYRNISQEVAYDLLEMQAGKTLEPYKEEKAKNFLRQMEYGQRAVVQALGEATQLHYISQDDLEKSKKRAKSAESKMGLSVASGALLPLVDMARMAFWNSASFLSAGKVVAATVVAGSIGIGYFVSCTRDAACMQNLNDRVDNLYYTLQQFDTMRLGLNQALGDFARRGIYPNEAQKLKALRFDAFLSHLETLDCANATN